MSKAASQTQGGLYYDTRGYSSCPGSTSFSL